MHAAHSFHCVALVNPDVFVTARQRQATHEYVREPVSAARTAGTA